MNDEYTPEELADPATRLRIGAVIREELQARGWSHAKLARVMGYPVQEINAVIDGQAITPEVADSLGAVFGTASELWLNLGAKP